MFEVVFTIITVGALAAVAYKYHRTVIAEYETVEAIISTRLVELEAEAAIVSAKVTQKKTSKKS